MLSCPARCLLVVAAVTSSGEMKRVRSACMHLLHMWNIETKEAVYRGRQGQMHSSNNVVSTENVSDKGKAKAGTDVSRSRRYDLDNWHWEFFPGMKRNRAKSLFHNRCAGRYLCWVESCEGREKLLMWRGSLGEFQREWRDFHWNVPYVTAKTMPLKLSLSLSGFSVALDLQL